MGEDEQAARETATRMLNAAGMAPGAGDVQLLADDIIKVCQEINDHDADVPDIDAAAYELERRIGGLANLNSYMACLRAGGK